MRGDGRGNESSLHATGTLAAAVIVLVSLATLDPSPAQTAGAAATPRIEFLHRLTAAAIERTPHRVRYVATYVRIPYPNGDVPADTAVCTDEIVRTYRAAGIDCKRKFTNICCRILQPTPITEGGDSRIPTSISITGGMVFFSRQGESLPVTIRPEDFAPGDLVTWDLSGG